MPDPYISPASGGAMEGRTVRSTVTLANADGVGEKTVTDFSPQQHGPIGVRFDLTAPNNAAWNNNEMGKIITVWMYEMIDGTNLVQVDKDTFTIGASDVSASLNKMVAKGTDIVRITIQINVAVNAGSGTYTINVAITEPGV